MEHKLPSKAKLQNKFQNLNAKVHQMWMTDGWTDRQTSSIDKPELLCNPAKKSDYQTDRQTDT